MYGKSGSNPFEEDDDDAYSFGNKGRYTRDNTDASGAQGGAMSRREQLMEQKMMSENRQLESTQRALASIYDSEQVGIATAEELVHQGEQLDNVERKTTEINQMTKTSQKHINNIRSIFGGIKNWWSGKKEEETAPAARPSKLQETLDNVTQKSNNPDDHPALRLRSDDDGVDSRGYGGRAGSRQSQVQTGGFAESRYTDNPAVDNNLDMMSDGMSKLKMMAMSLGDEIERQNDQIDRIQPNMDRAAGTIEHQTSQMKKILGK
ncbi:unnamed protein product [Owenia fusiformis]|uniref:Uncharacterized protein n=1 Tax=Owenia fusiformis TaxID=6347 RepID=A0A8J1TMI1_OWEFU|nr:unnamed protein product [Owenia fusiformis]